MKKAVLFSIAAFSLVSAGSIFAEAPKASAQLSLQATRQEETAVVPEANSAERTVVMTEQNQPARAVDFVAAIELVLVGTVVSAFSVALLTGGLKRYRFSGLTPVWKAIPTYPI